jgi:2-C-methyl-D-erythritol 2,4-cyclodiphosphate synthase
MFRIGHGYDVHRFDETKPNGPLILGGVAIEGAPAMLAHSDGDVLIHAVIDSLLGAAGLGDIGQHFPDTDPTYAGADSRVLLKKVMALLRERDYQINNLDVTIVAQKPKLMPYLMAMKKHLALDTSTEMSQLNIKATTTEKMGFVGREEGIAVHAVVLLVNHD